MIIPDEYAKRPSGIMGNIGFVLYDHANDDIYLFGEDGMNHQIIAATEILPSHCFVDLIVNGYVRKQDVTNWYFPSAVIEIIVKYFLEMRYVCQ